MVNGSVRGGIFALLLGAAAWWYLGPILFLVLIFFLGWGITEALPLIVSWIFLSNIPRLFKSVAFFAKMDETIKNSLLLRIAWWGVTFYGAKLLLSYMNLIPNH